MRYVKTGCVTSLFWLALIVPSLAQNTVRCTAGTVGGKYQSWRRHHGAAARA
ncbi:MAG: hypothetical protein M5U07_03475 [Xanthobacteraceae bacterium]|nr:hypothetical protein [Xanthobacteraceae bacterium]